MLQLYLLSQLLLLLMLLFLCCYFCSCCWCALKHRAASGVYLVLNQEHSINMRLGFIRSAKMPLPSSVGRGITAIIEEKAMYWRRCSFQPQTVNSAERVWCLETQLDKDDSGDDEDKSNEKLKLSLYRLEPFSVFFSFFFSWLAVVMFKMTGMPLEYGTSWAIESCPV